MKNVSLSLLPSIPAQQFNSSPPPSIPVTRDQTYSVTIGGQFDSMNEAISFATFIMAHIQNFNGVD